MPHPNWLEWFGYTASVVVAISLTMSSILKLRWYNLLGATLFSAYGFLIHAYPVGFLIGFIACVDIRLVARSHDQSHGRYLQKMGFTPTGTEGEYTIFTREIGDMPIHP